MKFHWLPVCNNKHLTLSVRSKLFCGKRLKNIYHVLIVKYSVLVIPNYCQPVWAETRENDYCYQLNSYWEIPLF